MSACQVIILAGIPGQHHVQQALLRLTNKRPQLKKGPIALLGIVMTGPIQPRVVCESFAGRGREHRGLHSGCIAGWKGCCHKLAGAMLAEHLMTNWMLNVQAGAKQSLQVMIASSHARQGVYLGVGLAFDGGCIE